MSLEREREREREKRERDSFFFSSGVSLEVTLFPAPRLSIRPSDKLFSSLDGVLTTCFMPCCDNKRAGARSRRRAGGIVVFGDSKADDMRSTPCRLEISFFSSSPLAVPNNPHPSRSLSGNFIDNRCDTPIPGVESGDPKEKRDRAGAGRFPRACVLRASLPRRRKKAASAFFFIGRYHYFLTFLLASAKTTNSPAASVEEVHVESMEQEAEKEEAEEGRKLRRRR